MGYNFMWWDSEWFKYIGCVLNLNKLGVVVLVCLLDIVIYMIVIYFDFCIMWDFLWEKDFIVFILIYEVSYFDDIMGIRDYRYFIE